MAESFAFGAFGNVFDQVVGSDEVSFAHLSVVYGDFWLSLGEHALVGDEPEVLFGLERLEDHFDGQVVREKTDNGAHDGHDPPFVEECVACDLHEADEETECPTVVFDEFEFSCATGFDDAVQTVDVVAREKVNDHGIEVDDLFGAVPEISVEVFNDVVDEFVNFFHQGSLAGFAELFPGVGAHHAGHFGAQGGKAVAEKILDRVFHVVGVDTSHELVHVKGSAGETVGDFCREFYGVSWQNALPSDFSDADELSWVEDHFDGSPVCAPADEAGHAGN